MQWGYKLRKEDWGKGNGARREHGRKGKKQASKYARKETLVICTSHNNQVSEVGVFIKAHKWSTRHLGQSPKSGIKITAYIFKPDSNMHENTTQKVSLRF